MATTISPKRKAKKKSVMKRIRQAERRTAVNRSNRSRLRTQVKAMRQALDSGNVAQARELLRPTLSVLDSSVHHGILHANTASRTKSRLLRRFNTLSAQAGAAQASA